MAKVNVLLVIIIAFTMGFFTSEYRQRLSLFRLGDGPVVAELVQNSPARNGKPAANPAVTHLNPELVSWERIQQLQETANHEETVRTLQRYLQIHPYSPQAWRLLAQLHQKQTQHRAAVTAWFRYLEYETDVGAIEQALIELENYLRRLYDRPASFEHDQVWLMAQLNTLMELGANNPELNLLLASLYLQHEDPYQAQYHALMALNDVATKTRAEKILAQLTGETISDEWIVPLQRYGNQYLVRVHIEGYPARLLIDTGASLSGLSTRFIAQHSAIVKATKPIRLNTANGAVDSYLFTVAKLALGELIFDQHMLTHLPMDGFAEFDGLLGVDILGRFEFIIDQDESVLRLKNRKN